MIKYKILPALIFFLLTQFAFAQRYLTKTFDSAYVIADIVYGSNLSYKGDSTALLMDIYLPVGDTVSRRPLVVLAHGGSFTSGSRKSGDVAFVCRRLAEMGYVSVSIDYRLGVDILSGKPLEQEYQQAVWRATQDNRAAIRFFRKSIQNGNSLKLDENQIFAGGISAGALMGLQLAFLDKPTELATTQIDTLLIGSIEGNSGNAGYDWRVKGVVNLCGALGKTTWMTNNTNISLCNMHGNLDATVPYATDYFKFFGANVTLVQGSFSVDSAAMLLGVNTRLHTFKGAGHVPFSGNSASNLVYMDSTMNYVARYLYKQVTGKVPAALNPSKEIEPIIIYPNPANDFIQINLGSNQQAKIYLVDMQGKNWLNQSLENTNTELNISQLPQGVFMLVLEIEGNQYLKKVVHQ